MYTFARKNNKTEKIDVVERVNGKRIFNSFPIDYSFYYENPNGQYTSIFRTPLSKVVPKSAGEFHQELSLLRGKKIFESDLNHVFKCLANNYRTQAVPKIQVAFLDIEVDFNKEKGYAPIEDPFNMITAITILLHWTGQLITLAIPPKTISFEKAEEIAGKFTDTFVFKSEIELLSNALDLLEDADVISGWNSEGFDLPYIINRICKIMSKDDTARLCLWGEKPKPKVIERYGKEINTYDLIGRTHLDLMDVYQKFNYEERHSYALNAIAEYELKESKTPYEGSLDTLYNDDFEKFIEYNRQDVSLLGKLEDKLKFIALLNDLAHDTTTLMTTCMGTVAMTDQAIINRAHDLGLMVPDKNKNAEQEDGAAGAYVAPPKVGVHEWLGVIDINSLYPSTIRALNMGIETIVGQLRPTITDAYIKEKFKQSNMTYAHAWENQFGSHEYQAVMSKRPGIDVIIDWENTNSSDTLSTEQCYDLIFNSDQKWLLSGNGTIFTYEIPAIIPGLLAIWYSDRKELQKKKKESITPEDVAFYDRRQHVRKINLNALYGALLNVGSRFHDKRVGQSTTLTGRVICKHMNSFVNECITGEYKIDGSAIIAADTDSSQFSAWSTIKPLVDSGDLEWNKEAAVDLYTAIGDKVNESFMPFMKKACNCPEEFGNLIKASCETVGYRGFYIVKKRYAILNYWKEGVYLKEPKLKAMGLDLRRSDTPVICQKFLTELLMELLTTGNEHILIEKINNFKKIFKELPFHEQGTPKRVNNLTHYTNLIKNGKGNRVPGHVRAAVNWNVLRDINKDKLSARIIDGSKCIVVPLKPNALQMTSIAYSIDEPHLPEWFKVLPFDTDSMMETVVEKKISNLLGKLPNWKTIENGTKKMNDFDSFFS